MPQHPLSKLACFYLLGFQPVVFVAPHVPTQHIQNSSPATPKDTSMKEETAEEVHLQFCLATHSAANITFFQMDQTTLLTLQAEYPLEQYQLGLLTVLSLKTETFQHPIPLRMRRHYILLGCPGTSLMLLETNSISQ